MLRKSYSPNTASCADVQNFDRLLRLGNVQSLCRELGGGIAHIEDWLNQSLEEFLAPLLLIHCAQRLPGPNHIAQILPERHQIPRVELYESAHELAFRAHQEC